VNVANNPGRRHVDLDATRAPPAATDRWPEGRIVAEQYRSLGLGVRDGLLPYLDAPPPERAEPDKPEGGEQMSVNRCGCDGDYFVDGVPRVPDGKKH
jgi:hypothetical protein